MRRMALGLAVLALAFVWQASRANAQGVVPDQEIPRHEAFTRDMPMFTRSGIVEAQYERDGTVVLVDGRAVPARFSLDPCAGWLRDKPIAEVAGPIEFVLVMPGEAAIDSVEFRAERPFYLAVAPIDQAQHAALRRRPDGMFIDYDAYADRARELAHANWRHGEAELTFIDAYLDDPQLPAVRFDVASASDVLMGLSGVLGTRARLPTLGEGYVAVRGGDGEGPFWSGDQPPWDEIVWAGDYEQGATRMDGAWRIRPAGDAPTTHPLGLREMIGGVADLVFPSESERRAVAARLAPREGQPSIRDDLGARYVVQAHTAVRLGGGIDGTWDITIDSVPDDLDSFEALDRATYANALVNLEGLFFEGHITANAGWLYHDRWATGLRPVIELPAGAVEVCAVGAAGAP